MYLQVQKKLWKFVDVILYFFVCFCVRYAFIENLFIPFLAHDKPFYVMQTFRMRRKSLHVTQACVCPKTHGNGRKPLHGKIWYIFHQL